MKTILFILFILSGSNVLAVKLVIIEKGERSLIKIHETGSYYDKTKVLWDERENGPIDKNFEAEIKTEQSERRLQLKLQKDQSAALNLAELDAIIKLFEDMPNGTPKRAFKYIFRRLKGDN